MKIEQVIELLGRVSTVPIEHSKQTRYAAMLPFLRGQRVDFNEVVDLLEFVHWQKTGGSDDLKVALLIIPEQPERSMFLTSGEGRLEIFGPEKCYRFGDLEECD